MRDYRFHCEDCDSYSQCQYYHNREGTSLICKEFQYGSSIIEQIRAEIQKEKEAIHFDISEQKAKWTNSGIYDGLTWAQEIIDKYTKGEGDSNV